MKITDTNLYHSMATPIEIEGQLRRGWQHLSDFSYHDIIKAQGGCVGCGDSLTMCLQNIVQGLQWRHDLEVFDETTDKLYDDMMQIIGYDTPVMGPQVDAGPSIIINQPVTTGTLNGTVSPGDNPIQSMLWTQLSGPSTAIFTSPTTAVTDVIISQAGEYVFQLKAIDIAGASSADITSVSVVGQGIVVRYGTKATPAMPDAAEIMSGSILNISSGQGFTIPFADPGVPIYYWFAYPVIEPVKTKWVDSDDPFNMGNIGGLTDLFGPYATVGTNRCTITQFETQFDSDIIIS